MNKPESLESDLARAREQLQKQRAQIARLRQRMQQLERTLDICLDDPQANWLYRNRSERMDPTVPIFDPLRAEFHLARYRFAAAFSAEKVVVDVACGTGYGSELLAVEGRAAAVHGFDIAQEAIDYAVHRHSRPNIDFRRADAMQLPIPDGEIDLVVSFETVEHVQDDRGLMREFCRVLRPGGQLIASTPNQWPLAVAPFHVREYDRSSWLELLGSQFCDIELFNQNSGSDSPFNHGQPAGIVPTDNSNASSAECFIATCKKPN